jgi:hypothetical protein
MDMNRNRSGKPRKVPQDGIERLTKFWETTPDWQHMPKAHSFLGWRSKAMKRNFAALDRG